MLSICIPTYNYVVKDLIEDLIKQCEICNINFEIIIIEDGSNKEYYEQNKKNLLQKKNVYHIILPENIGRSATRNMLASKAKYEKILFIDCDSKLPDSQYIKNYIKNFNHNVVCGGTIYVKSQKTTDKILRYKYGVKREMIKASERNKNSNQSFATNNFLISKNIFQKIQFREFLKKYGHEDSLFGYELNINSYKIHHIDNPVIHVGLEDNKTFLKKTEDGISNLILIQKNDKIDIKFTDEIKLIKAQKKIDKLKINKLINNYFKKFKKKLINNLINTKNPSILLFDLYKLGYYNEKLLQQKYNNN
ncbi:MAG: glycosyltransferase [Bacteroidales bacterium]|jgi:glycosyltransferase involved in cell wall biosynthesis|nr:glycosyltransferase [Bacteroidales bacterium]